MLLHLPATALQTACRSAALLTTPTPPPTTTGVGPIGHVRSATWRATPTMTASLGVSEAAGDLTALTTRAQWETAPRQKRTGAVLRTPTANQTGAPETLTARGPALADGEASLICGVRQRTKLHELRSVYVKRRYSYTVVHMKEVLV
jgi:hypothetical protein